jgi:hypothetical protein
VVRLSRIFTAPAVTNTSAMCAAKRRIGQHIALFWQLGTNYRVKMTLLQYGRISTQNSVPSVAKQLKRMMAVCILNANVGMIFAGTV